MLLGSFGLIMSSKVATKIYKMVSDQLVDNKKMEYEWKIPENLRLLVNTYLLRFC